MNHSIKEISKILNVSDRSVRRYLNSYFTIDNMVYRVSSKMIEVLKNEYLENSDIVVQEFTQSEYNEFHKRLSEYPLLKDYIKTILNELDYIKNHQKVIINRWK